MLARMMHHHSPHAPETGDGWIASSPRRWTRWIELPLTARLHVPGEDGRLWDASVPEGRRWAPAIPRANFLIAEQDGAFTLLTPFDSRPVFYNWELERRPDRLVARYDVRLAAAAPRDLEGALGWYALNFRTRNEAVAAYRDWMTRALPQPARHRPEWTERIPGCVLIQLWAGTGEIDHTFSELADLLSTMHDQGVPRDTLVYFWGWFAPFDRLYPEFWPARELGGEAGLWRVIDAARRYGYRLMPHTNHHGFSEDAPRFAEFASEQATDAQGNRLGWREPGEPAIEYMRPNSNRWRAYHIEKMKRFVDAFPVDAIFWDQYGMLADDPGCDYFGALHAFSGQLQAALPGLVLTSEILNERVYDLPVWMHWGTPWCGLPLREDIPHTDLIGALFNPLVARMYGHQGTPAAVPAPHTWPSYYWYIAHYGHAEAARRAAAWHRSVGAIPSARVNYREHGLDPFALAILTGKPDAG
jgi:hypothetical protein